MAGTGTSICWTSAAGLALLALLLGLGAPARAEEGDAFQRRYEEGKALYQAGDNERSQRRHA
jgi:hypothetical protein